MSKPLFSILTPTFNPGALIKCCVASVADQEGVEVQHIIQDNCSTDGAVDWLAGQPHLDAATQPDSGMYEALNRAWSRARGDYVAHLNSDEQYLPGALQAFARAFRENPGAEVLFSGALVTGPDGRLISARKALMPTSAHILADHLPVLTCAICWKRSAFSHLAELFDDRYRAVADAVWVLKLLEGSRKIALLNEYTSVFLDSGNNLALSGSGLAESDRWRKEFAPPWVRMLKPLIVLNHRVRKLLHGHYFHTPLDYAVHLPGAREGRVHFHQRKPSGIWKTRLGGRVYAS